MQQDADQSGGANFGQGNKIDIGGDVAGGDFVGRDKESARANGRVTIGSNVRFELPNGQPLEVEFARLETRMRTVERGQDMVSLALLLLSLLLVMQTIWMFSSKARDMAELNEKINSINLHVIRIETKMDIAR